MDIYLVKTFNGFTPANGEDDKIKRYKVGHIVKAKITDPRNLGFHRKFFALLKITFDNQNIIPDFENFREQIIIEAGFFTWARNLKGEEFKRAKSISFSRMSQGEFEDVYSKVIDVCLAVLGCMNEGDKLALEQEIINFL